MLRDIRSRPPFSLPSLTLYFKLRITVFLTPINAEVFVSRKGDGFSSAVGKECLKLSL